MSDLNQYCQCNKPVWVFSDPELKTEACLYCSKPRNPAAPSLKAGERIVQTVAGPKVVTEQPAAIQEEPKSRPQKPSRAGLKALKEKVQPEGPKVKRKYTRRAAPAAGTIEAALQAIAQYPRWSESWSDRVKVAWLEGYSRMHCLDAHSSALAAHACGPLGTMAGILAGAGVKAYHQDGETCRDQD